MSDLREAIWPWLKDLEQRILKSQAKDFRTEADSLLALLREHRLVELDKDQNLPQSEYDYCRSGDAQAAMLRAGWRKVKELA